MSKHLLNEELQRYLKRDLSPNDLLEADEHLAFCADCHTRLIKLSPLDFAQTSPTFDFSFTLNQANEHLDYETELQPFVDKLLNAEQTKEVQAHLKNCEMCRAEVLDLTQFRKTLAAAEVKPIATEKASGKPIWSWNWLSVGVAAPLLVALIFGAILFSQSQQNLSAPEIAKNTQQHSDWSNSVFESQKDSTAESPAPAIASPNESGASSAVAKSSDPNANKKAVWQTMPLVNNKSSDQLTARLKTFVGARKQSEPKLLPANAQRKTGLALTSGQIKKPSSLAKVAGNQVQLLGSESEAPAFKLLAPVATRIRSSRPTFRWQTVVGASGYRVSIFDSNLKKVVQSDLLNQPNWTVGQNLKRGEVYSWQVTAFRDDQEITAPLAPAPEAKFQIISAREETELLNALTRIENLPLQTAVVLAQTGLLDEAENKLQRYLRTKPNSKIARQLLQNIQSWR